MWRRILRHFWWRLGMIRRIYLPQFWYAQFLPGRVQSGPFRGMKYGRFATGSVVLPKLLGSYESELHDVICGWDLNRYDCCVDVGAGEGYYAVGFCYRFPAMRVIAFEATATGRRRIRRLAALNGLAGRLEIRGRCEPGDLQSALTCSSKALLFMDVEGYETILLDPAQVPALVHTDFVVEVHPEREPNVERLILERFANTHRIQAIPQHPNRELPEQVRLPAYLTGKTHYLLNEFRGPQYWLAAQSLVP